SDKDLAAEDDAHGQRQNGDRGDDNHQGEVRACQFQRSLAGSTENAWHSDPPEGSPGLVYGRASDEITRLVTSESPRDAAHTASGRCVGGQCKGGTRRKRVWQPCSGRWAVRPERQAVALSVRG